MPATDRAELANTKYTAPGNIGWMDCANSLVASFQPTDTVCVPLNCGTPQTSQPDLSILGCQPYAPVMSQLESASEQQSFASNRMVASGEMHSHVLQTLKLM